MNQYQNYQKWKLWNANDFGQLSKQESLYFDNEMAASFGTQVISKRVIEIGFGNGSFATWAIAKGADYSATEIIPALVETAKTKGIDAYFSESGPLSEIYDAETADLIVAFDVLEHLELHQIKEMLRHCRIVLRQGGVLFARVPSGDSPFARAIQHGDITHCSILGSSAIRQLAVEMGYEVIEICEPAFPVAGLGFVTGLRRGLVHLLRSLVNKFIATVLMANPQAVLTPNLVFVLRKN